MLSNWVEWASQASTAWAVLAGASLFIVVEAYRQSRTKFWGDLMGDDE